MEEFEHLITQRARSIDASGIRKVFDLAASVSDPINLSIGQPHFPVPEPIQRAASDAVVNDRNGYTVTQGLAELLEAVREPFDARFARDGRWGDYGALITSGVSGGLTLALMTCVEPGDEVLIPDPYFVMYKHLVRMAGGTPVFVDTYPDFRMTAERVEPLITERTKMILVSSPSNPTGVVLGDEAWSALVSVAEKHNVLLVSDEIYDAFCYEPVASPVGLVCPSPAAYSDRVLVLRGFSKTYGMTGWRLGYAMGPRPIVDQMTKLQQYTFVCAPSVVQHAGLAAMQVDMSEYVAAYRRKRDMVMEMLGEQFTITKPGGAFYAFVGVPDGVTGTAFAERAIERKVLTIPGCVFSERDTHLRLSFACDDATLNRGLEALVSVAGEVGK
ncbi:MAG: aminotransferase class I/II-fold pyridoxal phosphate-dependent enzyme [Phycisphaeraceae bacterium]